MSHRRATTSRIEATALSCRNERDSDRRAMTVATMAKITMSLSRTSLSLGETMVSAL